MDIKIKCSVCEDRYASHFTQDYDDSLFYVCDECLSESIKDLKPLKRRAVA